MSYHHTRYSPLSSFDDMRCHPTSFLCTNGFTKPGEESLHKLCIYDIVYKENISIDSLYNNEQWSTISLIHFLKDNAMHNGYYSNEKVVTIMNNLGKVRYPGVLNKSLWKDQISKNPYSIFACEGNDKMFNNVEGYDLTDCCD